ncbi:MAG: CPBP family intramembrane glutamic endopeptidase, partial [Candidatus Zixiibacteriota bacterium]
MRKNLSATILLLLFLLVGWPLLSWIMLGQNQLEIETLLLDPVLQLYVPTIIIELLIFILIILVLKRGEETLKNIGWGEFNLKNLFIGIGFVLFANAILLTLSFILNLKPPKDLELLLPKTVTQRIFWTIMSLTAGIVEEAGFRGYVLTKLNLFVKNWWITAIISSFFFGVGHFYQGWGGSVLTGVYGLLFCGLFIWRKSLA